MGGAGRGWRGTGRAERLPGVPGSIPAMVQEAQSIVGMTASTVAVIAGLLALFDRWAQRRQRAGTPAVAPEAASPSGLIVVSHARVARRTPAPARRALVPSLGRVGRYLRLGLVVLA